MAMTRARTHKSDSVRAARWMSALLRKRPNCCVAAKCRDGSNSEVDASFRRVRARLRYRSPGSLITMHASPNLRMRYQQPEISRAHRRRIAAPVADGRKYGRNYVDNRGRKRGECRRYVTRL